MKAMEDDPEFSADGLDPVVRPSKPRLLWILGPGLITGASDDDATGIAAYSQAGAHTGPSWCDDSARQVLARRVFPDGSGEDVGRHTISVHAFSIPARFRLDCRSGPLAPTRHRERSPVAAQVTWVAQ